MLHIILFIYSLTTAADTFPVLHIFFASARIWRAKVPFLDKLIGMRFIIKLQSWLLGGLYKNIEENLYKLYRIWFIIRRLRCGLYKNAIEIYTSYIVYGLLLGGYGVACIKMQ